jgi:8-oxo-dGTP pyrophosphatase MutT (NUDIX family)
VNSQGQVLLQQRHPAKETDPGLWDIAVAGHLSAGQTPLQALVREAHEELGLVLEPAQLTFLEARPKEYRETNFLDREWQHLFVCESNVDIDALVLQEDEVIGARWMDWKEYGRIVAQRHPDYVGRQEDWPAFEAWMGERFSAL